MTYTPSKWAIIEMSFAGKDKDYRIYTDWDRFTGWRLSSQVVSFVETEDKVIFQTWRGSLYSCVKDQEEATTYISPFNEVKYSSIPFNEFKEAFEEGEEE